MRKLLRTELVCMPCGKACYIRYKNLCITHYQDACKHACIFAHTNAYARMRMRAHKHTQSIASLLLSGYSVLNVIPCPHFRDGNTGAYIGQQVAKQL